MNKAPLSAHTNLLYHYTDHHGLLGIIERGELWGTNLSCLGDLSEFTHGLDYVGSVRDEVIDDLLGDRPQNALESEAPRRMFGLLLEEAKRRYWQSDPAEYLYVFSLFDSRQSQESNSAGDPGDNLQQWRTYSKGGFGYCIGFDREALELRVQQLESEGVAISCGRCIYSETEKRHSARRILSALLPACDLLLAFKYPQEDAVRGALERAAVSFGQEFQRLRATLDKASSVVGMPDPAWGRSEARELITVALSTYFGRTLVDSARMKHAAFAPENEWRIVRMAFTLSQEIKFRTAGRGIIPYATIPITSVDAPKLVMPGLIKRVVVGPLGNASDDARNRAVSVVKMLLEGNGIEVAASHDKGGVIVENSRLPC